MNVTTGDVIAVKQVELPRHPSKQEQEMVEALKFDSYTLKDLDHTNIVQFLGFEESVDHLSMCVEIRLFLVPFSLHIYTVSWNMSPGVR